MGTKGERTKKEICNAAFELFSERGYKDVSMQDICNATGLSKGGLYRHFGSKAEVLLTIVGNEKEGLNDIPFEGNAAEALEGLLKVYRNNMSNCKDSLTLALYECASQENDIGLDSSNMTDRVLWHKLVAYGVETGEFRDVDPDVVMDTFLYAYRGVRLWGKVLPFEEVTFDHITESVRVMLLK